MQNLSRSVLGPCSGAGSALPRWCLPAVARRCGAPPMVSAPGHFNPHLDRLSRFVNSPWSIQPHSCIPIACATTKCMDKAKILRERDPSEVNNIWFPDIDENSTHRDGAIYENTRLRKYWIDYGIDITDRNETQATETYIDDWGYCKNPTTYTYLMMQFFSLTIAESHIGNDPIQVYGYIAARSKDEMDGMLNYVLNRSRDDPIIVQQGSLIEMTGPKKAINFSNPVLIEFDMRIKNGEQEEDDLELIDGAIGCHDNRRPWIPVKHRVPGKWGTIDMSFACIEHAMEATIEVAVSDVLEGFSLSQSSYISVMEGYEDMQSYQELQLFHGTIDESRDLGRYAVAVTCGSEMRLKFKVGNDDNAVFYRSFKSEKPVFCVIRRKIKLEHASFSMKVTFNY
ncbi:hypothetical protein EJB05_41827 [Eragrostis curvula]|uniref:DUF6598 domain-containing protein n=1 Tax=Eragrostis curvula TaxID=38414 RepID=A0A5J9TAM9_9POAL|nr:hypothetical protein EJB05_41827 [Eragrostis curvula]